MMARAPHRNTMIVAHDVPGLHRLFDGDRLRLAVYLFASTVLFASLLLAFLLHLRTTPSLFAVASRSLHAELAGAGGLALAAGALALSGAERAVHRQRLARGLVLTALLMGLLFIACRALEGYMEYRAGLLPIPGQPFAYEGPRPHQALQFFHFHHLLAALHLLFMVPALLALLPALAARANPQRAATRVKLAAGYWAPVILAWAACYPAFYLLDPVW
ncbi:hypothetical protein ACLD02_14600 [Alloalcanivorax sp. C16-2]|uniref:hypothetical protein n=1 Tax=Alloalcanivorax TaxID=3020832 RepID=UPI001934024C|nr:hypothetical protein [Alloalcanivorax marinus]MBL7249009.1 hypothetical protein [Alloalcanivorax marinus]